MGFLDNLLKKEAQKFVSNVVDTVSEKLDMNFGRGTAGQSSVSAQSAQRSSGVQKAGTYKAGMDEQGLRQRLEGVIAQEWSDYELRREVPTAEIGAEAGARDISYGLYQDGKLRAVMMVLTNRNHYKRSDVLKVDEACRRNNIPYMNFMAHLPNRTDYISERLRNNIAG